MNISLTQKLLAIAAGLLLVAVPAHAGPRVVNCDDGDSLQQAIDAGEGSAKSIQIELYGTCFEDVRISRDRISVYGDGEAVISGLMRVFSADRLLFDGITLTGPGDGIRVINGRVRFRNSSISGNTGHGLWVSQGGAISLSGCTIEGNDDVGILLDKSTGHVVRTHVQDNGLEGIQVRNNASLNFTGGGINFHQNRSGVSVTNNSSVTLAGTHIGVNNPAGIDLSLGSTAVISETFLNANTAIGIQLDNNSSANVNEGGISWNGLYGAYLMSHSTLNLENVSVDNNEAHGVVVETDSALFAREFTRIEQNRAGDFVQIECRDKESSIAIDEFVVIDPPEINCPDPEF